MDQTVDHIHGQHGTRRHPIELRGQTEWLDTCLLGARLRIALEVLRLTNISCE
jgi:hypothetical protein